MTLGSWKQNALLVAVFLLASAAPNAFPLSMMGYGSLHDLAFWMILPPAALLLILASVAWWRRSRRLARALLHGSIAGVLGTLALEAVRYPGFLLGFMPGNLPELMGVLLLDRFAQGPSLLSNVAGFTYHFWNGACLGVIFAVLVPQSRRRRRWSRAQLTRILKSQARAFRWSRSCGTPSRAFRTVSWTRSSAISRLPTRRRAVEKRLSRLSLRA
jgi:hypothetical protein